MSSYRTFAPHDPIPADFLNAIGTVLAGGYHNFSLIIKPTDATVLQVPAGPDNDQVMITINGRWRYNTATVERASLGGTARQMDVHVTAADNNFVAGSDHETDSTDYSFQLAVTETGGTPSGVALSRKVGVATWDGSKFTLLSAIDSPKAHAQTHTNGGSDYVQGLPPIGAMMPYAGAGDPTDGVGEWKIADGRLVAAATYPKFDAKAGGGGAHKYNAGVDPGGGMVRLPDKRGKKSVGAINMGTGAGANDNAHHQAVQGRSYGEVLHQLLYYEGSVNSSGGTGWDSPDHSHGISLGTSMDDRDHSHTFSRYVASSPLPIGGVQAYSSWLTEDGAITPNIVMPYADTTTTSNVGWIIGTQGRDTGHYHSVNGSSGTASARHAHSLNARNADYAHNNLDPAEADAWIVRLA